MTISPGVYCDGITVVGNAKVTLKPGLYTIRGGEFSAGGSSELRGVGVTFFLTNKGTDFAMVKLTSTVLDFSPPTTGPYKGLLFFQDRDTPLDNTKNNILAGNGVVNFSGLVYMPRAQLDFRGGSSSASLNMFLVTRKLSFVGNSYISSGGASLQPSGLTTVSLVE
jgi:hypothetical protein